MLPPDIAIASLLARWLPGAAITCAPARSGASTPVWRVDTDAETFYLRLGEEPGERRDGEVRVHQLLRAAGVRVPEVVAWEGSPPELDRAATLTRAISGVPLKAVAQTIPAAEVAAIAREAGRDLATMNAIPVRGFGWIDLPDAATGALRAEHPARRTWLAEYDAALEEVIALGLLAPEHHPALAARIAAWRDGTDEDSGAAWLAHGDFDASHIFCTPGDDAGSPYTYTGIIDYGEARGADRCYDLGHALLHDGEDGLPSIIDALLDGYRDHSHSHSHGREGMPSPPADRDAIRSQAIAIGVRHLAIAHRRSSPFARTLAARLERLLAEPEGGDGSADRP